MKSLKTLIKLANQDLDNLRKEINTLLDQKEMLEQQRTEINQRMKQEYDYTMIHVEAKASYDMYVVGMNVKLENIGRGIAQYDTLIEPIQEKISEAFSNLKKYEILLDKRQLAEIQEIARKEQIVLDEMGISGHLRKLAEQESDEQKATEE